LQAAWWGQHWRKDPRGSSADLGGEPTSWELHKGQTEKRKANAAKGRAIRKELRQMERELIAGGLLDKHWRSSFTV